MRPTDFLWPDEAAYEEGRLGWIPRTPDDDEAEIRTRAAEWLGDRAAEELKLTPVLAREESEVEAKINGHEFPLWVECTKRAKAPEPFWRVELSTGSEA